MFVDYQNTHHRAREMFGSPGDPPTMGHVHPHLLDDLLLTFGESGGSSRVLVGVANTGLIDALLAHHRSYPPVAEAFRVWNMEIGFAAVVDEEDSDDLVRQGHRAFGSVVDVGQTVQGADAGTPAGRVSLEGAWR